MESAFFVSDFAICSRAERWFYQIQICAAMRPRIWCTNLRRLPIDKRTVSPNAYGTTPLGRRSSITFLFFRQREAKLQQIENKLSVVKFNNLTNGVTLVVACK